MSSLLCDRCMNNSVPRLERRSFTSVGETRQHLGAYCTACGSWIKWVPQNEEWVTLFNQQHDHPMYPQERQTMQVTE